MSPRCRCQGPHRTRRVVLTGGPGAGKTAVLELARLVFCRHLHVLPEAASIVFGGGFPREDGPALRRAGQRAIFFVQRELEASVGERDLALVLCDRGTLDGAAYWPGPDDFFAAVGTTPALELARYDAVIHLRTPGVDDGYNHSNPLRVETALQASVIDERIAQVWAPHPHRFVIEPAADFVSKANATLKVLQQLLPGCCQAGTRALGVTT